ncbi:TMEM175 family protein [Halomarina ordinaria]|uniref:TMEM175 family protein n=1 Tax=Halomarina ordinaria TaxID=3033939 RepID=A0ABD5U679_9EURY|nr:TMEM175 family protein [Halomarina sp. PSRA2]
MRVRTVEGEGVDRVNAISDGVFAIVLTLLVLQFEVPDVPAADLWPALRAMRPLVVSYLLTFSVVGLYWVVHHNLFDRVVRHDRVLLYLNLLFLLTVSFLPFPTELVGVYGTRLAWTLYAVNFAVIGLLMTCIWAYAARRAFLAAEVGERTARLVTLRSLISPAVFLVSIAVSLVNLDAAYLTPLLIVPLQALWVRRYGRPSRP